MSLKNVAATPTQTCQTPRRFNSVVYAKDQKFFPVPLVVALEDALAIFQRNPLEL